MNSRALVLLAFAWTTPSHAMSTDPCRYDAFTPENMQQELTSQLALLDTDNGTALLMRDSKVIGHVEQTNDVRQNEFSLTVADAARAILFSVNEHHEFCNLHSTPGMCRTIEISTEQQPVTDDGIAAFSVKLAPNAYYADYYRYGVRVSFLDWRLQLADSVSWLADVFEQTTVSTQPRATTRGERLYWALASERIVAPYLPQLVIDENRRGDLIVTGTVPSNAVFDRVVVAAHAAGFWTFDPRLVIDTGMDRPYSRGPTLSTCFR